MTSQDVSLQVDLWLSGVLEPDEEVLSGRLHSDELQFGEKTIEVGDLDFRLVLHWTALGRLNINRIIFCADPRFTEVWKLRIFRIWCLLCNLKVVPRQFSTVGSNTIFYFFYFRLFKWTPQTPYNKYIWKIHPVYGAGIRTHNLQIGSVIP